MNTNIIANTMHTVNVDGYAINVMSCGNSEVSVVVTIPPINGEFLDEFEARCERILARAFPEDVILRREEPGRVLVLPSNIKKFMVWDKAWHPDHAKFMSEVLYLVNLVNAFDEVEG